MANPKIQLRHDTSTNWQTQNPVLLVGEVAIETDSNKVKIGNGTDNYNTLPYITDQTKIDLDYSNADYQPVNKAGDTMTGALALGVGGTNISLNNIPDGGYSDITFSNENKNRLGFLRGYNISPTQRRLALTICNNAGTPLADLSISSNADVAFCTFPNTTCCDGQFISVNTQIMSSVSLNGSSSLTYTLNLPSDGRSYLVWLTATATTGNTNGNYVQFRIYSDAISNNLQICATRTRAAAAVGTGGSIVIPVTSSHKIYVPRDTEFNGTANLWLKGYRRIGTNS